MIRTQVYLPEPLHQDIGLLANKQKKPKAEIIRVLLQAGMSTIREKSKGNVGDALVEFARSGVKGPGDLSAKIDKYLYEEWEKQ